MNLWHVRLQLGDVVLQSPHFIVRAVDHVFAIKKVEEILDRVEFPQGDLFAEVVEFEFGDVACL